MSPQRAIPALVLLAAAALALPACVLARYQEGNRLPAEEVERIRPGETTKAQVLEWLGPPQSYGEASVIERLLLGDDRSDVQVNLERLEDVLVYEFHEGRARGLLLLLFNYLELRVESDRLVLFFDAEDRVRYLGVERNVEGGEEEDAEG